MIFLSNELIEVAVEGYLIPIDNNFGKRELILAKSLAGDTLLHVASAIGNLDDVKLLLSWGANVNSHGDYGYTPLHYSAELNHVEIYKFLVKNGANPELKNSYGDKANDLF